MNQLEWGKRTFIMGIINITPDSFSGDGILMGSSPVESAVEQAKHFVEDGADILDLGAESSRPGSESIPASVEIKRILPILQAIKKAGITSIISIDTYKAETAKICLENGAHWINDIWGLRSDPKLGNIIASFNATVILMHNRSRSLAVQDLGRLGKSYSSAKYTNIAMNVKADLAQSIQTAKKVGIPDEQIILDPGIGFGKNLEYNLGIIKRLDAIKSLGYPVLIGPSRKSFIGQVLDLPVEEREEGTAAAIAIGIAKGADIVRVHDVRRMARVARMSDAIIRG